MSIPIAWLVFHFIADFVLQSNWQAQNKSKRWDALALHCFVYASVVACGVSYWVLITSGAALPAGAYALFWLATFASHFLTDAVTSRINSRLWNAKRVHGFFVGIGADQVVHYASLAATGYWLGIL